MENIKRFFPEEENVDYSKLKLTEIGKYSISKPTEADCISNIIINTILKHSLGDPKKMTITDATGGFGGNILSFARHFRLVIGIEKHKVHYDILKNNINVFNYGYKVNIIHSSFIKIIPHVCKDVIFIDPPWGGKKYRFKKSVMLHLDQMDIFDIINQIPSETKLIALKIPFNFDYRKFIQNINPGYIIGNHKIKNYYLLIIVRH